MHFYAETHPILLTAVFRTGVFHVGRLPSHAQIASPQMTTQLSLHTNFFYKPSSH